MVIFKGAIDRQVSLRTFIGFYAKPIIREKAR